MTVAAGTPTSDPDAQPVLEDMTGNVVDCLVAACQAFRVKRTSEESIQPHEAVIALQASYTYNPKTDVLRATYGHEGQKFLEFDTTVAQHVQALPGNAAEHEWLIYLTLVSIAGVLSGIVDYERTVSDGVETLVVRCDNRELDIENLSPKRTVAKA